MYIGHMKAHNKIGGSKRLYREPRPRFISPHRYVMLCYDVKLNPTDFLSCKT